MSQRAALLVSAVLTALILVAGVGLTARIVKSEPAIADAGDASSADDALTAESDQDRVYQESFDRLQDANAALAASYDRIASLLDTVEQLQTQNAQLREREALYQQRLTEANSRLESQGQTAITIPPAVQMGADAASTQSGQQGDHERD